MIGDHVTIIPRLLGTATHQISDKKPYRVLSVSVLCCPSKNTLSTVFVCLQYSSRQRCNSKYGFGNRFKRTAVRTGRYAPRPSDRDLNNPVQVARYTAEEKVSELGSLLA